MDNVLIRTEKLSKTYSKEASGNFILKNIDVDIYKGDFTVIMGPSGSGKSTLLNMISGMDKNSLGEVYFDDNKLTNYSDKQLADFRSKKCGFVFQNIYLMESMNTIDNILVSGLLSGQNKKEIVRRAKSLLNKVGLKEDICGRYPSELSGGQLGRVGLVRAMINEPTVIFADEPTGALDSTSGEEVLNLLSMVNDEGQSVVMVTHDLKSAIRGNRILYLKDGVIVGELKLDYYKANAKDLEERKDTVISFLEKMGW